MGEARSWLLQSLVTTETLVTRLATEAPLARRSVDLVHLGVKNERYREIIYLRKILLRL